MEKQFARLMNEATRAKEGLICEPKLCVPSGEVRNLRGDFA
jgi:hypothetical protein